MSTGPSSSYEQIYELAKAGYTGDSAVWDRIYEHIRLHLDELFYISPKRCWSIGHQIVFHVNYKLLERILLLYNEDNPIDIYSVTKDQPKPKTILDIAIERKSASQTHYKYIEHLFDQDKFIKACQQYNWIVINDLLDKDENLLNEKPPYRSNYFIHYLVLNGDVRKFAQYNTICNKFILDLKNADNKTALDLAREKNNECFIKALEKLLPDRDRESSVSGGGDRRAYTISSDTNQYTMPEILAMTPQLLQSITCTLTKQIFINPVIANDGKTYEREAIINYLKSHRTSPQTGELMDATLKNDIEMKNLISHLRHKKLIS